MSSKGWAGLVGKTVDWGRKIGDGAPSEHPSGASYLSHGSVCLGIQESVCDCAWKSLAKGQHGLCKIRERRTKDIQHVICK